MKQTEKLIIAFGSFGPVENLFVFYDTGNTEFEFEEIVQRDMTLLKAWIRLDLENEEKLISELWGYMIETVWQSNNPDVVLFFMDKMKAHDHMKFRDDFKNFVRYIQLKYYISNAIASSKFLTHRPIINKIIP